jgi:hypothetical protein
VCVLDDDVIAVCTLLGHLNLTLQPEEHAVTGVALFKQNLALKHRETPQQGGQGGKGRTT